MQEQPPIPPQDKERRESDDDKEIIIPAEILDMRERSFARIIGTYVKWDESQRALVRRPSEPPSSSSYPNVDTFAVPHRSGPISTVGLPTLLNQLGIAEFFPKLVYVQGVGNEIYNAYFADQMKKGDIPTRGIDPIDDDDFEERIKFNKWIAEQPPESQIGQYITKLKADLLGSKHVALLDDTTFIETTSAGVFPGMFFAASIPDAKYEFYHNQYIFPKRSDWLEAIARETLGAEADEVKVKLYVQALKGGSDNVADLDEFDNEHTTSVHSRLMNRLHAHTNEASSRILQLLKEAGR